MIKQTTTSIEVFKGLQKPLVFHSFKGKYIYWGAGFAIGSLIIAIVLKFIGGYILSVLGMAITLLGGLYFTAQRQKRGQYNKTVSKGIYIISRSH